MPPDIAPVFGMMIVMSVPLAIILSRHQQKMAKIIHGEQMQAQDQLQMRNEMNGLRQDVRNLSLSVELLRDELRTVQKIDERLSTEKISSHQ